MALYIWICIYEFSAFHNLALTFGENSQAQKTFKNVSTSPFLISTFNPF